MIRTFVLVVALGIGPALEAAAATPVPSGRWSFVFTDQKGRPDRPIRVFTYRPKQCDSTCPMVFVLHGAKRDAYALLNAWQPLADLHKFIVLAPQFEARHWQKAAGYNQGDVKGEANREKWAYSAIEHVFDEVNDGQKDYVIFGQGAGGQFVQGMAFFRPDNRARVMIAASPGWYTMPEWRKDKGAIAFPYSLLESPAGANELKAGLARKVLLIVAEHDEAPDDEGFEKRTEVAKSQGETRIERGENFIKAATAAAQELGVKLGWELNEAPDKVRDSEHMARYAAEAIYGKR
jgi:pimeloyl-ACP methyl ester carboxylesterase